MAKEQKEQLNSVDSAMFAIASSLGAGGVPFLMSRVLEKWGPRAFFPSLLIMSLALMVFTQILALSTKKSDEEDEKKVEIEVESTEASLGSENTEEQFDFDSESEKNDSSQVPPIMWSYWEQGWEEAPLVCQVCAESWELQNPQLSMHKISAQDLPSLVPELCTLALPLFGVSDFSWTTWKNIAGSLKKQASLPKNTYICFYMIQPFSNIKWYDELLCQRPSMTQTFLKNLLKPNVPSYFREVPCHASGLCPPAFDPTWWGFRCWRSSEACGWTPRSTQRLLGITSFVSLFSEKIHDDNMILHIKIMCINHTVDCTWSLSRPSKVLLVLFIKILLPQT